MKAVFHILWYSLFAGSFCQSTKDHYGRDFILSFNGGLRELRRASIEVIAKKSNTAITIAFGTQKRHKNINNRFLFLPVLSLLLNAGQAHLKQPSKAIRISSSSPVVVYRVQGLSRSICIPVKSLSNKYIVANYLPSVDCKTHFSVIAGETGAKVNIKFEVAKNGRCGKFASGNELTVPLFSLDVFPVRCNYDMTGTRITSDKPIAVIVRSECPMVVGKKAQAEMMLLPHTLHGTSFVLNANKDRGSFYRVVPLYGLTKLESSDGKTWNTEHKKPLDIELLPGKSVCVKSTKPVHVIGGPKTSTLLGRIQVLVTEVPSTGQFLQNYNIHSHVKHKISKKRRSSMKYIIQAIVQKDVAHLLLANLKKLVKNQINLQRIDSCEFVILSTTLSFKGLLSIKSPVPFGLNIYEHGRRSEFGISPVSLLDITNCPTHDGFLYFPNNDWCLRYEKKTCSRREARKICRRSKGHLVDIVSKRKHAVIKTVYGAGLSENTTIYTGGFRYPHYNNRARAWLWSDCSPLKHRQWNKGRKLWKCMTLQGSEMTLTQTDCHTNASSICEFDVSHVQKHGHIVPFPVRKSCRQKHHGHKRVKNLSSHGVTKTTSSSQTSIAFSTATPSKSSTATSMQDNLNRTKPTTTDLTEGTAMREQSSPFQHRSKKTTVVSSSPRPTEPEYEEYEIRDDYDEPKSDEDKEGYVDYVTTNRTDGPIAVVTTSTPKSVEPELTNSSQPSGTTLGQESETLQHRLVSTTQPRIRTLNMTLVMEAYMKHTNNSKAVLAAKAHILTLAKKVKQRCHCFCKSQRLQNTSEEAVTEHKEKVKKELGVKKSTLRKTLSKKMSADDKRPSAAVVGCIGFLFLLLPFAIIVLSDINTMLVKHRKWVQKKKDAGIYVNRSNDSLTTHPDKY